MDDATVDETKGAGKSNGDSDGDGDGDSDGDGDTDGDDDGDRDRGGDGDRDGRQHLWSLPGKSCRNALFLRRSFSHSRCTCVVLNKPLQYRRPRGSDDAT